MIRPVHDNLVIKPEKIEKEVKSSSGIVLSQNNGMAKPDKGTIISIGEGRVTLNGEVIKSKFIAGDKIIYNRFSGTEVVIDGESYLIIKENDVLAVIE